MVQDSRPLAASMVVHNTVRLAERLEGPHAGGCDGHVEVVLHLQHARKHAGGQRLRIQCAPSARERVRGRMALRVGPPYAPVRRRRALDSQPLVASMEVKMMVSTVQYTLK